MRKGFREAERLLLEMGFTILGSGRSKHHYWLLRTPGGKEFKQPIPHDTSERRFWLNWKTQLRRRLNEEAGDTDACCHQPAGGRRTHSAALDRPHLDAPKRKGDA